jgi:hypothetical protein
MKLCINCYTVNPDDAVMCSECGMSVMKAPTGEDAVRLKEQWEAERRRESETVIHTEHVLVEATGVTGQLELLETKVRIKREGVKAVLLHGLKGDKEILIRQISSIQFKNAGMWTNGYIQISFLGGQEAKGGLFQATQDENTVVFNSSQQSSFERIRAAIEERMTLLESGEKRISYLDELERLASLRDKGIITEEEFNAKKQQLLDL